MRQLRVAIVGSGAAGVAMAMALTDALPSGLDLTIFDPAFRDEEEQGRGYPYQRDEMHPLVNAPARMMSVRVNDSDHFSRWHERQHGKPNGQDAYVSRPVFGDYLRDCLIDLRRQWSRRDGLLHRVPEEAMSLDGTEGGKYSVRTPRATYVDFDHVVLCTGWRSPSVNIALPDPSDPHAYPLSDSVMRTMAHPSVGVVGTGLTAVDFIRALLQSGYSGRIVAASRRGLLPAARSQWSCPQPAVFTPDLIDRSEVLSLRSILGLIEGEAIAQEVDLHTPRRVLQHGFDSISPRQYFASSTYDRWAALFVMLCDTISSAVWNLMDTQSRRAFDAIVKPYFQAWCNPIPPQTAELLLTAIESGQLEIRGGYQGVRDGEMQFLNGPAHSVSTVVKAARTTQPGHDAMNSPLIEAMLASGTAVRDSFGGVQVNYGSWDLLSRDASSSQGIYAVGSLTKGARYYVNALDSIVRAVDDIARGIVTAHRETARPHLSSATRPH